VWSVKRMPAPLGRGICSSAVEMCDEGRGHTSLPDPPAHDASATLKMAYKLKSALGKAIYGLRKCTVEPVIGIIKEVLGFRQFSLRGEMAGAGEWCLVCLAFNLKRLHSLLQG
jgi:Transposase DDE domain